MVVQFNFEFMKLFSCLLSLLFIIVFSFVSPVSANSRTQDNLVKQNHDKLEKVKILENYYLKRGRDAQQARKEAWDAVNAQEQREKLVSSGKIKVTVVKPSKDSSNEGSVKKEDDRKASSVTSNSNAINLLQTNPSSFYNSVKLTTRPIDLVLVRKSLHRMELIKDHKVVKQYFVAFGKTPKGHKVRRGDGRTPEGNYVLDYKKTNSEFALAIHISYPNAQDRKEAKARGVDPGGMIMIHGQPNNIGYSEDEDKDGEVNVDKFLQPSNWTNGCIALLNDDMKEVYRMIDPGTPITILP